MGVSSSDGSTIATTTKIIVNWAHENKENDGKRRRNKLWVEKKESERKNEVGGDGQAQLSRTTCRIGVITKASTLPLLCLWCLVQLMNVLKSNEVWPFYQDRCLFLMGRARNIGHVKSKRKAEKERTASAA